MKCVRKTDTINKTRLIGFGSDFVKAGSLGYRSKSFMKTLTNRQNLLILRGGILTLSFLSGRIYTTKIFKQGAVTPARL